MYLISRIKIADLVIATMGGFRQVPMCFLTLHCGGKFLSINIKKPSANFSIKYVNSLTLLIRHLLSSVCVVQDLRLLLCVNRGSF